ncbi:MAG: sigma-70 family RNA polymerase sigma factor [Thermoanaerobaculia bacterium]
MTEAEKGARFARLVRENRRRLAGIAGSYARGEEVEDLTQEILLQLWRSLDSFAGRSSEATWLYRVALNTALGWRRRRSRRSRFEVAVDGGELAASSRSAATGGERELTILRRFLASLSPEDRALFLLYLDDLTYREMAEITGLSESHVGVKLHRMKQAFVERNIGS